MKVIDPGHKFKLNWLDSPTYHGELQFVKREGERYLGNIGTYPGTTTQEVLRACISRSLYVNNQIFSIWTWIGIQLLRLTIFSFEWRAKRVKGKWLSPFSLIKIEQYSICQKCGHILCTELHKG